MSAIRFHVNRQKPLAAETCARLAEKASKLGIAVTDGDADVIVVLGGDGTFLRAVHDCPGVPLLGLNLGGLGYLSSVEEKDIVLGVAGLFPRSKGGFFAGILTGSAARFLVHYVVGATIWADYMPESFFRMTMTTPWLYSALYNGAFMLPDTVLCLAVGAVLWKPLGKFILGGEIKQN